MQVVRKVPEVVMLIKFWNILLENLYLTNINLTYDL